MSSDGGGLLPHELNGRIDPTRRLAGCLVDHRNAAGGEHDVRALVAQRVVKRGTSSRRLDHPVHMLHGWDCQ